jgi:hypothetical protein
MSFRTASRHRVLGYFARSRHRSSAEIKCAYVIKGKEPMLAENTSQPADALLAIGDATLVSRSPTVLTAEVDGEIVMMSIEQGRYYGLDDIGSDIWGRIEPPCSFAELVDRLVADYDADRATIAADVQVMLGRMAVQDVVRLS